jgi:hypothetical protein
MMDILFYYYYLLCKKCGGSGNDSLFGAVCMISSTFSFYVIISIELFCSYQFHRTIILKEEGYSLHFAGSTILLLFYLYYMKSGRWKKVIRKKPKLLNSHILSIVYTIGFSILSLLVLGKGTDLVNEILDLADEFW